MSIERDPEQPAFPREYVAGGHKGMTLRDWFAGQIVNGAQNYTGGNAGKLAERAYQIADAMMVARLTPAAEQKDRTNG